MKINVPDFDEFPIRFAAIASSEKSLSSHHASFLKRRLPTFLNNRKLNNFEDLYVHYGLAYLDSDEVFTSPWIAEIGVRETSWIDHAGALMDDIYSNWSGTIRAGVAFTLRPINYARLLEKPLFWHEANGFKVLSANNINDPDTYKSDHICTTWLRLISGKLSETELLTLIKNAGGVEYIKMPYSKLWKFIEHGSYDPPFLELYSNSSYSLPNDLLPGELNTINLLLAYSEEALYYEEMWQVYKRLKFCTACGNALLVFAKRERACLKTENSECFKNRQKLRKRKSTANLTNQ